MYNCKLIVRNLFLLNKLWMNDKLILNNSWFLIYFISIASFNICLLYMLVFYYYFCVESMFAIVMFLHVYRLKFV